MESVRLVQRIAILLRALQGRPASSLADLHRDTGMAKPTLLRLLGSLEQERMVWRAMGDGLYRTRVALERSDLLKPRHLLLVEAARPHLAALQRAVLLPSDLTVRAGREMLLIETSRRESTLDMHRDPLGYRIDLLHSAVGRAWLAFCPAAERERILDGWPVHATRRLPALERDAFERVLAQTRARGYGMRDSRFGGLGMLREARDDHLAAIAVPVMERQSVIACINLVWHRRISSEREIARRNLGALQSAATAIAAAFKPASPEKIPSAGTNREQPD
jgi:IclR family mhp operon transcriptional activator